MFSAPQALLGVALLYTIQENNGFDNSAMFIVMAMAIIISLYYLLRISITAPLIQAVEIGLESIDQVIDGFYG